MSNISYIEKYYKPYSITKNKNVIIINSSQGKFVLKKEKKDIYTLFNYLSSRGFDNFPKLVKNFRDEENLFEYVEDKTTFKEQKYNDLVNILASLHNKTVYYKSSVTDNYKEIYEDINSNLKYLSNYYHTLFLRTLNEEFQSPSNYLFARNYYKIKEAINFCKDNLQKWYDAVNKNDRARVSVVHNNIRLEHLLENEDKKYLISWDNYKIDTPIIDFVNFYHNEYLNTNFSSLLEEYLSHFELLEEEKNLLFILISMPLYFKLNEEDEIEKVKIVHDNIIYLYKTEKLIEPYFSNSNNTKED